MPMVAPGRIGSTAVLIRASVEARNPVYHAGHAHHPGPPDLRGGRRVTRCTRRSRRAARPRRGDGGRGPRPPPPPPPRRPSRNPTLLARGRDATASARPEASGRAAGKASRGGLPNALFVVAAAEAPP